LEIEIQAMSNLIRSPHQAASLEMIAKLIRAGYLQAAVRNDPDAITNAIARMKQDLRGRGSSDDAPTGNGSLCAVSGSKAEDTLSGEST
jgi:hypothetical protein